LSADRGHKLQIVIEVETGESVNHLEALAQWAHFSKTRAAFHLYVPAGMVDVARRLSEDNHIYVAEIWSFHMVGDQVRFTLVHRNREAPPSPPRVRTPPRPPAPAPRKKPAPRSAKPVAKKAAAKRKRK
jgi:hypothetical protein